MTKTAPEELAPSEHAQRLRGHAARFDSLCYFADAIMLRETAAYLDRLSAPQQVTEEVTEEMVAAIIYEAMHGRDLPAIERVMNPARLAARKVLAALSPKETT